MKRSFHRLSDFPPEIAAQIKYMGYVSDGTGGQWQIICGGYVMDDINGDVIFTNVYANGRSVENPEDAEWHHYEEMIFSRTHEYRLRTFDLQYETEQELSYDARVEAAKMRHRGNR